jgi:hypothetical protein
MDLSRDVGGYRVRPHKDSSSKLVTTLFYLPKTALPPALAPSSTRLLKPKSAKGVSEETQQWSDFQVITTICNSDCDEFGFGIIFCISTSSLTFKFGRAP